MLKKTNSKNFGKNNFIKDLFKKIFNLNYKSTPSQF